MSAHIVHWVYMYSTQTFHIHICLYSVQYMCVYTKCSILYEIQSDDVLDNWFFYFKGQPLRGQYMYFCNKCCVFFWEIISLTSLSTNQLTFCVVCTCSSRVKPGYSKCVFTYVLL